RALDSPREMMPLGGSTFSFFTASSGASFFWASWQAPKKRKDEAMKRPAIFTGFFVVGFIWGQKFRISKLKIGDFFDKGHKKTLQIHLEGFIIDRWVPGLNSFSRSS